MTCMWVRIKAVVLFLLSGAVAIAQNPLDGVWVAGSNGRNLMKVEITTKGGASEATVTHPKQMIIAQDGTLSADSDDFVTEAPIALTVEQDSVKFANGPTMTRTDNDHAKLSVAAQIRPVTFLRVPAGSPVVMGARAPHGQRTSRVFASTLRNW